MVEFQGFPVGGPLGFGHVNDNEELKKYNNVYQFNSIFTTLSGYALKRRLIVMFDEWMMIGALIALWQGGMPWMVIVGAGVYGGLCTIVAYAEWWKLERVLHAFMGAALNVDDGSKKEKKEEEEKGRA